MRSYSVRRFLPLALAASALLLAACGDKEVGSSLLKPVHEGMPKDSLAGIIGNGPLTAQFADSARLERGFRRSVYIVDGKQYEVLYYREAPGNVAESVLQAVETPVVLSDGKVLGWGWKFYNEAMEKYNLPSPLKADSAAVK
ncbi:MAG: hypothetical protein V4617_22060 [Gemmatimonadota bacterium]